MTEAAFLDFLRRNHRRETQPPRFHQGEMPHHAPSLSNRAITGRVTEAHLESLGLGGGTAMQELLLDRVLGNRESRARLLAAELDQIRARSETRLLGRRSRSRWDNLSSTFKQFVIWSGENLAAEDLMSVNVGWKIIWWVESKLLAKDIELPSARKYVKNLVQSCKEAGLYVDVDVTDSYKRSLERDGALRTEHQAKPATRETIARARQFLTHTEYLGLILAWKTASRIGEMSYLRREHFEEISLLRWSITFPYHKGDQFRLGTNIVIDVDVELDALIRERLDWVPNGSPVTDLTTQRCAKVLKAIDPEMSAHSVKRGALTALLRAGVPLSVIQAIAKHKDLETLLVYLPRSEVSMAIGTPEATRHL